MNLLVWGITGADSTIGCGIIGSKENLAMIIFLIGLVVGVCLGWLFAGRWWIAELEKAGNDLKMFSSYFGVGFELRDGGADPFAEQD